MRPKASLLAAEHAEGTEPINLGTDHEITIRETAERIAALVGFEGDLVWDPTQPDGQPRRRVDPSRAEARLGWRAQMPFDEGLRRTIDWYRGHRDEAERRAGLTRHGTPGLRTPPPADVAQPQAAVWSGTVPIGAEVGGAELAASVPGRRPGRRWHGRPVGVGARRGCDRGGAGGRRLPAEEGEEQRGRLLLVQAEDGGVAHRVRVGGQRVGVDLGRAQRGQAVGQRGQVERGVGVHALQRRLHQVRHGERVVVDGG